MQYDAKATRSVSHTLNSNVSSIRLTIAHKRENNCLIIAELSFSMETIVFGNSVGIYFF